MYTQTRDQPEAEQKRKMSSFNATFNATVADLSTTGSFSQATRRRTWRPQQPPSKSEMHDRNTYYGLRHGATPSSRVKSIVSLLRLLAAPLSAHKLKCLADFSEWAQSLSPGDMMNLDVYDAFTIHMLADVCLPQIKKENSATALGSCTNLLWLIHREKRRTRNPRSHEVQLGPPIPFRKCGVTQIILVCAGLRDLLVDEVCKNRSIFTGRSPQKLAYLDAVARCIAFLERENTQTLTGKSFSPYQKRELQSLIQSSRRAHRLVLEHGDKASESLTLIHRFAVRVNREAFTRRPYRLPEEIREDNFASPDGIVEGVHQDRKRRGPCDSTPQASLVDSAEQHVRDATRTSSTVTPNSSTDNFHTPVALNEDATSVSSHSAIDCSSPMRTTDTRATQSIASTKPLSLQSLDVPAASERMENARQLIGNSETNHSRVQNRNESLDLLHKALQHQESLRDQWKSRMAPLSESLESLETSAAVAEYKMEAFSRTLQELERREMVLAQMIRENDQALSRVVQILAPP